MFHAGTQTDIRLVRYAIERTVITHGRSHLKPYELCSPNVLNFLSFFQIFSFDNFGDIIEANRNRFIEKMLEIFAA